MEAVIGESGLNAVHQCKCTHHHSDHHSRNESPGTNSSSSPGDGSQSSEGVFSAETPESTPEMRHTGTGLSTISFHALDHDLTVRASLSNDATAPISRHMSSGSTIKRHSTADSGSRRKVAKMFVSVGNALGAKAQDWFDDSEFKTGKALDWPEIPGEPWRNERLQDIRDQYNPHRDADGNATPRPRSRSQASSYMGGVRATSPYPGLSLSRSHSPTPQSSSIPRQQRASTLPEARPHGFQTTSSSPLPTLPRGRQRMRRDTLEVPPPSHHNLLHIHYSQVAPVAVMSGGRSSPPSLKNDGGGDPLQQAAVPTTISSSEVVSTMSPHMHRPPSTHPTSL